MATPQREIKTPIKSRILSETTPSPKTPRTPKTPVDSTIKRRISDILVNLHKCVQIWERDNQSSFNTANTLVNLYSQWNTVQESDSLNNLITSDCKEKYKLKMLLTREDLLKQLKTHKEKLTNLISKMNGFKDNIRAIFYLGIVSKDVDTSISSEANTSQEEFDYVPIVFNTWTVEMFLHTIEKMLSSYTKEYIVKMKFYKLFFDFRVNKSKEGDTSKLTNCISIWLHQPYIDDKCKFYLDSMLVEAELK